MDVTHNAHTHQTVNEEKENIHHQRASRAHLNNLTITRALELISGDIVVCFSLYIIKLLFRVPLTPFEQSAGFRFLFHMEDAPHFIFRSQRNVDLLKQCRPGAVKMCKCKQMRTKKKSVAIWHWHA